MMVDINILGPFCVLNAVAGIRYWRCQATLGTVIFLNTILVLFQWDNILWRYYLEFSSHKEYALLAGLAVIVIFGFLTLWGVGKLYRSLCPRTEAQLPVAVVDGFLSWCERIKQSVAPTEDEEK